MKYLITCAAVLGLGLSATADTINVPEDYATIQEAINASVNGDVVEIAAGTYYEYDIRPGGRAITIRGAIDEDGNPLTTIDAEMTPNKWVLVCFSGETATTSFENLIITRGAGPTDDGSGACGGMYNFQSSPSVINCVFVDNAGGMYNFESSPQVRKSQFLYNTKRGMHNYGICEPLVTDCIFYGNQNGTYQGGGGMKNDAGASPTVTGCLFESNVAMAASGYEKGGGVLNRGNSNSTYVDCTFIDNVAGNDGGGMCCENSTTTVSNCVFQGNHAKSDGGGLCNQSGGTLVVTNCMFTENTAYLGGGMSSSGTPEVTECVFTQNTAQLRGGAIYSSFASNFTLTASTFFTNSAVEQFGGGVYIANLNSGSITDCLFDSNSANSSDGGGLSTWGVDERLSISNCMFQNNSSIQGGAINSQVDQDLVLTNTTFSHNDSVTGAAIAIRCTWLTVDMCKFRKNTSFAGSAIMREDCATPTNGDCQITATEFCGNSEPVIVGEWTDNGDNLFTDQCPMCPGDFDGSDTVDVSDLLAVIAGWNNPYTVEDLLLVISQWNSSCL